MFANMKFKGKVHHAVVERLHCDASLTLDDALNAWLHYVDIVCRHFEYAPPAA